MTPDPAIPTTFKLTRAVRDRLDLIADTLPRDQRNRSAAMRIAVEKYVLPGEECGCAMCAPQVVPAKPDKKTRKK